MYNQELIKKCSGEVVEELKAASVKGVGRFLSRLKSAPDDEEKLDILAQGRFALILAHNGFDSVDLEPSDERPDIVLSYEANDVFFEIRRRRPRETDFKLAETKGPLWGKQERDENVISLIKDKMPQLVPGEINIVVIWSNTVELGYPHIQEAFKSISKEIDAGTLKKLSGLIFVDDPRLDLTLPNAINLFTNEKAEKLMPQSLVDRLSSFCRSNETIQKFLGY
jgi:hypothetical protein